MTDTAGEPPDPWVLQYEFTSKRLNRLAAALRAQTYLEIGCTPAGSSPGSPGLTPAAPEQAR
jgi:hypothetical protein